LLTARRGRLLLFLQLGLFVSVLGLVDGSLGVVWPTMRRSFHRPLADLGVIALAGTALYLAGSASVGWITARTDTGRLVLVASVIGGAALTAWATAAVWPLVLGAVAILGLSRGLIDGGLNAHIALHGGVRRLGLLHASYGGGATVGPLMVTAVLAAGADWRLAIGITAASVLGFAALAWLLVHDWPGDRRDVGDAAVAVAPTPPPSAFALPMTLLTFVIYTGVEAATGAWAYTLLTEGRGVSRAAAGAAVAAYWGALTVGRLGLGALGHRVDPVTVLHASCALTAAGLLLLWADPGGAGVIGLPLAGLGLAAMFPVLIALAPDRMGPDRAPRAIGLSVGMAAIGGPAFTAIAGYIAEDSGLHALAPALFAGSVLLTAVHLSLWRIAPCR
jgi:fucose permease